MARGLPQYPRHKQRHSMVKLIPNPRLKCRKLASVKVSAQAVRPERAEQYGGEGEEGGEDEWRAGHGAVIGG